jgi:hypothetical protein
VTLRARWVTLRASLGDAKSSLGDAKSSLGDAKSSLGDTKSSLGDTKSSRSDVPFRGTAEAAAVAPPAALDTEMEDAGGSGKKFDSLGLPQNVVAAAAAALPAHKRKRLTVTVRSPSRHPPVLPLAARACPRAASGRLRCD